MKTLSLTALSLAVLAACGGSQPPIGAPGAMPQSRMAARGHNDYAVTGPLLYVTNALAWTVTVYHASARDPAPIATISQGLNDPSGACVDGQGTLYITNQPNSGPGWVSEYPLGKTTSSKVITKGINTAAYCAIDSNGNLWVTNIGGPNVTEYLYGSKRPHTVITQSVPHPVGIAIDRSGNLYVANRLTSSNVVVYAPGSKTPSRTITDGITSPVAIAVDANGVLYVANVTEANVEEYQPGRYHPFKTITQGLVTPVPVTVNKKGWLYVANDEQGVVLEYRPGFDHPIKAASHDGRTCANRAGNLSGGATVVSPRPAAPHFARRSRLRGCCLAALHPCRPALCTTCCFARIAASSASQAQCLFASRHRSVMHRLHPFAAWIVTLSGALESRYDGL